MRTQPFPTVGALVAHLDLSTKRLVEVIGDGSGHVYAYVMSTVALDGNNFLQLGTAPNFQGGYITLCTCKHRMRSSLSADQWCDKWVAGFTSVKCGGRHWLFYLARVKKAYESHTELWYSDALPAHARRAKSATRSIFGDLYEPRGELEDAARFDPACYRDPISEHRHARGNIWWTDIDYSRKKLKVKAKQQPSLLVCDPDYSFLWRRPLLYVDGRWRQKNYGTLDEFLQDLKETPLEHHGKSSRPSACRC